MIGQRGRLKQRIEAALARGDIADAKVLTDRLEYLREKDKHRSSAARASRRPNQTPSQQRAELLRQGIAHQDLVIAEYQSRRSLKHAEGAGQWVWDYFCTQIQRAQARKERYMEELEFIRSTIRVQEDS